MLIELILHILATLARWRFFMLFVFIMVPLDSSAFHKSYEDAVQASRAAGCDQARND